MKRRMMTGAATLAVTALVLSACGGTSASEDGAADTDANGDVETTTITFAGWSLATTPEFQVLADGFEAANDDVTVEIVEYADGDDYDTQMITDLAAGTAPDVYPLKNLNHFHTYQDGGQLLEVSDVAAELGDEVNGLENYIADGDHYAVPYRQDAWYLFYNKDLFEAAGIAEPDGTWTWDDFSAAAVELTEELADTDTPAKGAYQHSWRSTVQGLATAQSPDVDYLSAQWDYLVPYYERFLDLQDAGAITDYGTVTTNSLSYQGQFGTQEAAMLIMGSWYVATLVAQQESGEADDFEWGIAPAPQYDSSITDMPVTFGDPTGLGINAAADEDVIDAAKRFLAYTASEDAAIALAEIGITPAVSTDAVTDTFFALDGIPTDELSQFSFSTYDVRPENYVDANSAALDNILNDAHSAIMSGSTSAEEGIAEAMRRANEEVLN